MPHKLKTRSWPLRAAFWTSVALIGGFSLLPPELLPPQTFSVWDKAQHAGGFALLTVLGQLAYRGWAWRMAGALLAYGALIEWAQWATGWRTGDLQDLLADAVGIGVGALLVTGVFRRLSASGRQ